MEAVPAETEDILPVDYVPEILDSARQDEYLDAYLQEYQPVGPTEHALVRELARHAQQGICGVQPAMPSNGKVHGSCRISS